MAPYQERVVAEKVDLDEKIDKLTRIPIKTRLKMITTRTVRLWLLPLEALLQMLSGPNK